MGGPVCGRVSSVQIVANYDRRSELGEGLFYDKNT
jgi:hypothetical protein